MTTECLTIIKDESGREIAVIGRGWNGDPLKHGKELAKLLTNRKIVTEINPKIDMSEQAKSMNNLAANLISYFTSGLNNDVRVYCAGKRALHKGGYLYWVTFDAKSKQYRLVVADACNVIPREIFAGTPEQYLSDFLPTHTKEKNIQSLKAEIARLNEKLKDAQDNIDDLNDQLYEG